MATRTGATPANQQSQGAGDTGSDMLMLSLGVGAPIFLLSGAMLWLLWRRQKNQHKPALQGISHNAQISPWMSSRKMYSTLDSSQYASNAQASPWISSREMQSTLDSSQYASSAAFAPGVSGASGGAGVLSMLGSTQPIPSPQLAYAPSDPHPMMPAFPRQRLTIPSSNTASYPQNSGCKLLLTAPLNLPLQLTEARDSNKNGQMSSPVTPPTALMDAPALSTSSLPLVPTVGPPSITDDPMLKAVMRQAQMGLFALSGR